LADPKADVTLNASPEMLRAGPIIKENKWEHLDNPGFIESIHIHYHLPGPSAMGGGGVGAPGGVLSGADTSRTNRLEAKP
jgi:hypothetical protein